MTFYFAFLLLSLLLAIAAVVVISRSKISTPAKGLFAAFAYLTIIFPKLMWLVFPIGRRFWIYRLLRDLEPFAEIIGIACLFGFAFTLSRNQVAASIETFSRRSFGKMTPTAVWNTDLTPTARHNVLRRREWAYLIDHAPVLIFLIIAGIAGGLSDSRNVGGVLTTAGIVPSLWWLFYVPLKDANVGQSIGKKMAKCRVVEIETGTPIGVAQSLIRNIPLIIPGFALVEFVVAMVRQDRRRLGDLLAGTIAVNAKPQFVDGVEVPEEAVVVEEPAKHPLD